MKYIELNVRFHAADEVNTAINDFLVSFDDKSMETIRPHHSTTYVHTPIVKSLMMMIMMLPTE